MDDANTNIASNTTFFIPYPWLSKTVAEHITAIDLLRHDSSLEPATGTHRFGKRAIAFAAFVIGPQLGIQ